MMDGIDLHAFRLYWLMIWAVVGSGITPLIFDRRNRNPWWGAVTGLVVGVASGQIFGYGLLWVLYGPMPNLATWASMLGGLVLLIPLWFLIPAADKTHIQHRGFVAGTVTPLMFYLLILSVFPLLWAFILAFFDYSPREIGGPILGLGGNNPFVGLEHFQTMLSATRDGRTFRNSMGNTLAFTALVLPLNLMITVPLAVMIESVHRLLKPVFRTIYFLPVVTSSVGVAVMWGYIFHAQYGLLNNVFSEIGLAPVAWLQDQRATVLGFPAALFAVVIAYLWQDFGYNLVIFIAALQGISESFKEAARVDGASSLQIFWHITLPLLRPTILLTSVLTVISSFQVFDIIQVMTQGGPGRPDSSPTRVLVLDIYENAFRFENMGWAAAISVVMFGFIAVITFIQSRVLRTDWEY
ncbi:sugar ABC transporter permease [Phototrophicus methaneseepsis]|uniref:Sugar ABC transporter permease n=1 Tax=Phototrophicus methaneseepsis TaxID=2710758 RepID=A0A7S8EAK0_9CHLR|nr:sugar ABC transporter permease [Phototrophicus methaneseepsis]QPC83379.1 sugar ABC transporter permease [Phototrophicus methaneseepsis]